MQEQNYPINKWAKNDRPREKLRDKGASQLSDSELLAILLGEGIRNRSAIDLARELLQLGRNDLNELGKFSIPDFKKIRGIGEAKAVTISAALELGRRRQSLISLEKIVVKNSREVAEYVRSLLRDHLHEVFGLVFLNQANKVKHYEIISQGGITGTVADPRIIFKKALAEDAVSIILFHNHPSGNVKPSRADINLTQKIVQGGKLFDIRVMDHVIVSEEGYFSFADEGLI